MRARYFPAIVLAAAGLCFVPWAHAAVDPYEQYVQTSKDFRPVRQDPAVLLTAFPSWTYMPWTYQWTIGYTPASGGWSVEHGYNGAFVDWDGIAAEGSKTGRLDWINQNQLRFYVDHTAAKHYLHLWDGNDMRPHVNELHSGGVRSEPVNAAMAETLHGFIKHHIETVKSSPYRAAYALDDEISWGHFVHPTMWCVTDDKAAYSAWLTEIYGAAAPERSHWITYNDIQPRLRTWTVGESDASPLMDQWTFNDSYWNNFLGDLVEYANGIDPATPCGFVGGQCPSPFGGYDYAKVMRKVQFIEAYNIGSSQAIIRSFNPQNAIPAVTSHFHRSADDDIWQTWYYLAHGNRGMIGWVEGWFDGKTPKPWHDQVAPTYLEAGKKIGPLMSGAQWMHDGVAIYYSHPSIQLGWIFDAEAHGKTWTNRNGDDRLGASHHVRHAWENMLRDEGLQYNFLSYADVIQKGIPAEYKVLVLPACLCLSDVEARRIEEFCKAGGTVIADYLPGLWDQHGKGRSAGGVLDEMFGVKHDPKMSAADVFGGKLWCEVNQDANFSWKTYEQFLTRENTCIEDPAGFNKAVRNTPISSTNHYGKGTAVLMNLSPQWYNAYRVAGAEEAKKRAVFLNPLHAAGVQRWASIVGKNGSEHGVEITYWKQGTRRILFACLNPEIAVSSTGGGNAVGLKTEVLPVTLTFAKDVKDARDERTGKDLGAGREFKFDWKMNEAIVVSFAGEPGK
ncbi:MAG: hypothetical protein JWP03_5373 [Phycisphaerales bacterium]|nr:hypothetical protein [Phycisphaerales bacterium]